MPLLITNEDRKLITYQPTPIPFTDEEEALAAYRVGLLFEVCSEDERTKETYREMSRKRDKTGIMAGNYLHYWEEEEKLAEQNYRTAAERSPRNEKYREKLAETELRRVCRQYKEATALDPENPVYQEISRGLEKDFAKEELYA